MDVGQGLNWGCSAKGKKKYILFFYLYNYLLLYSFVASADVLIRLGKE
jgi:hypothetical protein